MVCIPTSLYHIFYQLFLDLSQYFWTYKGFRILKYDKIQTFQIDRGDYDQNMHSVKKIPLLDFLIQRL